MESGVYRIMKKCFLWLVLFGGLCVAPGFGAGVAAASQTPLQAIRDLDRMTELYRIGESLSLSDKLFNRQLKKKMLTGTFDLEELASLALAEYWETLSNAERKRFVKLLTNLLEERSVFAKERAESKGSGKSYRVIYHEEIYQDKNKTRALAKTSIELPKKKLKLAIHYKLKKNGDEWKIFDVIMDDASLIANYKFSFGSIIKKHGYPELVRRMEEKLKEFRNQRRQS